MRDIKLGIMLALAGVALIVSDALSQSSVEHIDEYHRKAKIPEVAAHRLEVPSCDGCLPLVMYCKKPVSSAANIRGRKVRSLGQDANAIVKKFGGIVVMIPFAEVNPALKMGVIDCSASGGGPPR